MPRNDLLHQINFGPITEGLRLLPSKMDSLRARAQMLKMALQESKGIYRDQLERAGRNTRLGPALGLWQFERGGACASLLKHPSTKGFARMLCDHFNVQANADALWRALPTNDVLAAAMARLNLYWHESPLPDVHDELGSFEYYIDCWRPGAYERNPVEVRKNWAANHATVIDYLTDPA